MSSDFPKAVEAFQRGDLGLALEIATKTTTVDDPQWQHLIGLIHCRQGDLLRGLPHLQLAAETDPANLPFKVMYARALVDAGRPDDVLAMARPRATHPTAADLALWHARAEAAAAAADTTEAADAWKVISDCEPRSAEARSNLAKCMMALERFSGAQAVLEAGLQHSPFDISTIMTLGLIYERTNQLDRLARLIDEAVERGISTDKLSFLRALREQRAGNLATAREHLLRSNCADDPVRWNRLRAKIADREGDVETAFDATVALNQSTPDFDAWRQRAAIYRQQLRDLAATMTTDWARQLVTCDTIERAPVFLVGFPRSGTTLLDTFLMGHPSIRVIEEREILRRAGEICGAQAQLPLANHGTLERARRAYLDELGRRAGSANPAKIIDKNPFNMVLPGFIHTLFPSAQVIFAKRHPCDAVLSGFMQSFTPNLGMASFMDIADAADLYDAMMDVWTNAANVLDLNTHAVTYEKLVEKPEDQLRPVIEFLGLEWDDRLLDHRATAKNRGAIPNTSYDQVTEKLNPQPIGRWRRYEKQLQPVLAVLQPWAERLGYII